MPGAARSTGFNAIPDLWLVGYSEVSSSAVGVRDARLGPDVRRHYSSLIGFATFFGR